MLDADEAAAYADMLCGLFAAVDVAGDVDGVVWTNTNEAATLVRAKVGGQLSLVREGAC